MNRSEKFARFAATDSVSDDLKRRSVLGALTTGAGGALDFVLRFGSTLVLARLLVPEQFGVVAMVTAFTRIAERFANLGLSTATVQAPEVTDEQCSNLFWINFGAGLLLAAALVLFSPAISGFYDDDRLQAISIALSVSFLGTGLTVQHEALLRRQMKLPQVAANRLMATLVSVSIAIGLAWGGFGYWALVWKEVAQSLCVALGSWILCPWIPGRPRRNVDMRRLLGFGRDMTLTQILLALSSQLDSLLIGRFIGAVVLGLYRQAYNLMMMPVERLRAPIFSVSQPGLSILQQEPERYRRYYERILFAVSLATMPLGVLAVTYAREIVLVALGENWLGAVVFLRIFGVAAAIQPALGTAGTVLVTCGRSGRFLWVSLVNNAVFVVLMVLGIQWGAVGVASARVATSVVVMPWALHYSFAGTPVSVRDFLRSVSSPVAASIFMGAGLLGLRCFARLDNPVLSLLAGCGTAIVLYFLAFHLMPAGRSRLWSLTSELRAGMKRRSSEEANRDAT